MSWRPRRVAEPADDWFQIFCTICQSLAKFKFEPWRLPVSSGANFQDPHGKRFLRYRRWTNYRQTPRVEFKYKYDSHTSSPFEQCLANPQQDQSISRMQWVLGWHGSTRYGFAVTYSGFSAGSFLYLGAAFTPSAGMEVLGMASQSCTQDSRRGHSYI